MFDIGWTELLVIGIVALIVVGPKDLPVMFRVLGQYTGRAKAMAREFTRAMESAADEAGVRDIQKDLRKVANPGKLGLDAVKDATADLAGLKEDAGTTSKAAPKTKTAAPSGREAVATTPKADTGAAAQPATSTASAADTKAP